MTEDNETPPAETPDAGDGTAMAGGQPRPSLFRNYISYIGLAILTASVSSLILLLLIDFTRPSDNPYNSLVTFVAVPAVVMFGLFVTLVGAIIERRRRLRSPDAGMLAYPVIDLNDPRRRRSLLVFLGVSFVFVFMSAFISYEAYEYTESVTFCGQQCHSVMNPEFVAYNASPHASIRCVECHVGEGAGAYIRSKFTGMRQLYGVATGHYNRPIHTPVLNLRSATETCQKCHWSEKYHGDILKVFNHYGSDENNSLSQTQMLLKVGGGDSATGPSGGIHWHMNVANDVTFIAADAKRQVIPWVRFKDASGSVVDYTAAGTTFTADEIEKSEKRKMDCVDCHNRPAHDYLSPNRAVDRSLEAGRLNLSIPFIKAKAVEVLTKPYNTNDEAVANIAAELNNYYRTNHAAVYNADPASIAAAVAEVQLIYQTYFFPEMKTDWRAHANNIGHFNTQGCFRCHDGQHFSPTGKVIRNDCSICHTTVKQTFANQPIPVVDGKFQHPVDLGDRGDYMCATCHRADAAFKHPLNLGDISKFKCADCHSKGM